MKKILNKQNNTLVFAILFQFLKLFTNKICQKFFSLDLRQGKLVRVIPKEKLLADKIRQINESLLCPC
jgi:hypothetical protein